MLNNPDKRNLAIALSHLDFLSFSQKQTLLNNLDNVRNLALMSIDDISTMLRHPFKKEIKDFSFLEKQVEKDLDLLRINNIGILHYDDINYPFLLKQIYDPPFILYYRGNIKAIQDNCIGIVGTRNPSGYGMKAAMSFASDAAKENTVISGLASGIDAYAQKGALLTGKTVSILANGLDSVYPVTNRKLAVQIIQCNGCLISEYPPGVIPTKWYFPQRNRIISGLSKSVVVIEAPPSSGALITVEFAIEQNRDVFFHEAAVRYEKILIDSGKMNQIVNEKNGKYFRSVSKYIEDGAKVINSFDDLATSEKKARCDKQLILDL